MLYCVGSQTKLFQPTQGAPTLGMSTTKRLTTYTVDTSTRYVNGKKAYNLHSGRFY